MFRFGIVLSVSIFKPIDLFFVLAIGSCLRVSYCCIWMHRTVLWKWLSANWTTLFCTVLYANIFLTASILKFQIAYLCNRRISKLFVLSTKGSSEAKLALKLWLQLRLPLPLSLSPSHNTLYPNTFSPVSQRAEPLFHLSLAEPLT